MRTVAVILSYWPRRLDNVRRIVDDLLAGDLVPDRIIVANNGPRGALDALVDRHPTVTVADLGANFECRAKFVVAMLDVADYYLLADDDTTVGPGTLAALGRAAKDAPSRDGAFVTGYWGVRLVGGSFMRGQVLSPGGVEGYEPVDAFHGRVVFCDRYALTALWDFEADFRRPDRWPVEGDDLLIGLANPDASFVVPLRGRDAFVDLDQCGQAMQFEEGYLTMRDVFAADALAHARAWSER